MPKNIYFATFILLFSFCIYAEKSYTEPVERIVAIVNEDIITQSDMSKFAERLKSGSLNDDLLISDESTRQATLKDPEKALNKMIDAKLLDSEVRRQNLGVPMERVEQEIRSIAKHNGISRDELKAALLERGVDFAEYQDFIKTGLERQGLIKNAIASKIKISEDDVIADYLATQGNLNTQSFEYTLAHILFLADTKGGAAAIAKAKDRAILVHQKLRDGASFEKVASESSEDPNFENGGLLGTFKTGELNKELAHAIENLETDEFSGLVRVRSGFEIVRVIKKQMIPDPKLEKEKEKIRSKLYEQAYKKQLQSWLEQLKQEAFIRINPK
jgi:peptidyl-prolyl cis-trans isomerase SurA